MPSRRRPSTEIAPGWIDPRQRLKLRPGVRAPAVEANPGQVCCREGCDEPAAVQVGEPIRAYCTGHDPRRDGFTV